MKGNIILGLVVVVTAFISGCNKGVSTANGIKVTNLDELNKAIKEAQPGDLIIMANGVWKDVEIKFVAHGTLDKPITLLAENMGQVSLEGKSCIKLGGEYLVVKGLYFKNGYTPSDAVINFKKDKETLANHCRVTECVIENYNQPMRDMKDHWVELWGRHNELDHCYIAGKANDGPTVRIFLKGNESIKNFHKITKNHFGPRPRKGGPHGETMQIGDSYSSMCPSNTLVAENLFEECNGEVEVISSKTNFNEFRNNVFYKCEGSLVTRHGNYTIIDGNYFIGDVNSENIGGIRLINTGHWVTNNYFINLKGKQFRSPLAVMNGIPKSPLNRYLQVTDAVIAYNTYINCESPWHFGVGSNVSEKDVLPLSEIRSDRPDRCIVANNVIYNQKGDPNPIVAHDSLDGITFASNVIDNNSVKFRELPGVIAGIAAHSNTVDEAYLMPSGEIAQEVYQGFDFETITNDIFGNKRDKKNQIGAILTPQDISKTMLDYSKYGASWYSGEAAKVEKREIKVSNTKELVEALNTVQPGSVILLASGEYVLEKPISIAKSIGIHSADGATIRYTGPAETALFQMNPKGDLALQGLTIKGNGNNYAFATLKENMSSHYNLEVSDCKINSFNYVLKAYKESMAQSISFVKTEISQCANGIELSQETNDKGDYNVEFLNFDKCIFLDVKENVIDYYRGGYDESTIGGNLNVSACSFTNCGANEENGILLNHRGIIHVNIHNNMFKDNAIKRVSVLWGAKDNHESGNKITNSGSIEVQQNLALKMMY